MKPPLSLQPRAHSPNASLQALLQLLPFGVTTEHQDMESGDLSGLLNTVSASTLGRQGLALPWLHSRCEFALPALWAAGKLCNCVNTVASLN